MRKLIFVILLVISCLFFNSCAPQNKNQTGIKIILEEKNPAQIFSQPPFQTMANPTSTGQFSCFVVNVTGPGVPSDVKMLNGCNSANNMMGRGFGAVSRPTPRGGTIEMDVPAGTGRSLDVYGVYPTPTECGGTPNSTPGAGYYLGGVTRDMTESLTVTIPISFTADSLASRVTCPDLNNYSYRYFVYAAGGGMISSMEFNPGTGTLSDIATVPRTTVTKLAANPAKTYLYAADSSTGLGVYAINQNGSITLTGNKPWPGANASYLKMSSTGGFIWGFITTSNFYPGIIDATTGWVNFASTVTANMPTTANGITDSIANASYKYGFVSDGTLIKAFDIDATSGSFSYRTGSTSLSGVGEMTVTPNGSYLYAVATTQIWGYSFDATSAGLTAISGSPFGAASLSGLQTVVASPDSSVLIAVRATPGHSVDSFRINNTPGGSLSSVSSIPLPSGGPMTGVFDPSGRYFLAADSTSANIAIVPVNTSNGALSAPTYFTLPYNPVDIKMVRVQQ